MSTSQNNQNEVFVPDTPAQFDAYLATLADDSKVVVECHSGHSFMCGWSQRLLEDGLFQHPTLDKCGPINYVRIDTDKRDNNDQGMKPLVDNLVIRSYPAYVFYTKTGGLNYEHKYCPLAEAKIDCQDDKHFSEVVLYQTLNLHTVTLFENKVANWIKKTCDNIEAKKKKRARAAKAKEARLKKAKVAGTSA